LPVRYLHLVASKDRSAARQRGPVLVGGRSIPAPF